MLSHHPGNHITVPAVTYMIHSHISLAHEFTCKKLMSPLFTVKQEARNCSEKLIDVKCLLPICQAWQPVDRKRDKGAW